MEKKFNLYDLFGVLFPGAVLCLSVYVFLARMNWVSSSGLGWSETVTLLPVAYTAGVFVHLVASWMMHEKELATKVLADDDQTFTAVFKRELKNAYEQQFGLPVDSSREARQTMFDGCYDYVIQRGKGSYIENHYAKYGLCRSTLLLVPFIAILMTAEIVRDWTDASGPRRLLELIALYAATIALMRVFMFGTRKFIRSFTTGVYRTFYAVRRDAGAPIAADLDPEGLW